MAETRPTACQRERSLTLPNSLRAPREARELCRDVLAEWGLEEHLELALLLVSELVTNSVRYTAGEIGLRIIADSGRLRVEIHDDEPRLPVQRQADSTHDSGRGLLLVEELSAEWGARIVEHWQTDNNSHTRGANGVDGDGVSVDGIGVDGVGVDGVGVDRVDVLDNGKMVWFELATEVRA